MKIGCYYYPEHWPRKQWERDFDRMATMGMQIVHMGEFAWFEMEPAAGEIQLDWLASCVEHAHRRGMQVILCTPTAAPPIWLVRDHPEILPRKASGEVASFGGRKHYTPTAPAMIDATRRIVTALAERFGDHPAVIGWQIDNEYGTKRFDTGPHTQAAFQAWLRQKYGTIDALNDAWACAFWNTYYTDWSEIRMPQERAIDYDNPHHHLDACRFWSAAWGAFNKLQADILRPRVGDRFITTNLMPFHPDVNPDDLQDSVSLMSWDAYPVSGLWGVDNEEKYRLADPDTMAIVHDQLRGYNGRWALMELQPGQINWSGVPVLPYPGAIRLWIWLAFAHGAEFVTTYRFRQPRWGTEMFHAGLVNPDGVTLSPGGREFAQVAEEIRHLDPADTAVEHTAFDPDRTVGLVFDFEQLWAYLVMPQAKQWDLPGWLTSWYRAAAGLGLDVRVLRFDQPWPDNLKLVIAPGVQMLDPADSEKLSTHVGTGGHLLLTCRTGWTDRRFHLWEGEIAQPILPLIGATIASYDGLPLDRTARLDFLGQGFDWRVWGEQVVPGEQTEVLARYTDQFYRGAAAVTSHRHGSGAVVTYCGAVGEQAMVDALLHHAAAGAALETSPLPARVRLARRGNCTIAMNFDDREHTVPMPAGARLLIGQLPLKPAGVAVWRE